MRPQTCLVPLDELVLEPERDAARSIPRVDRAGGRDNPFPLLIITPEKRVIAGRTCLAAYRASGRNAIPCRVAHPEEIDTLLTRIHNRILYEDLPEEQLELHLDLYAELCLYRRTSSEPATADSGIPGSGRDRHPEYPAANSSDEPGPDLSDGVHPPLPTAPHELHNWHPIDPFWFF